MISAYSYQTEVELIATGFEYELCEECGQDLDRHMVAPDPLGHAHAYCLDDDGAMIP